MGNIDNLVRPLLPWGEGSVIPSPLAGEGWGEGEA
jgi:hypothetical protein